MRGGPMNWDSIMRKAAIAVGTTFVTFAMMYLTTRLVLFEL
jgi:hypothetical protein